MGNEEKTNDAAIIARIVMEGKLVVVSPICIGDGSGEESRSNDKDIKVQKNKQGDPFIPGTSMCGVLRCFAEENMDVDINLLFGGSSDDADQSVLQIYDTVLKEASLSYRDGVAINYYTGVANDGSKYDYEIVDKGEGIFRLEAVIRQKHIQKKDEIRKAVVTIKNKLIEGIQIGAMTAKGLGMVELHDVNLGYFDLESNEADVKAWFMSPEVDGISASDRMQDEMDEDTSNEVPLFEGEFELRSTMIIRTDNMDIPEDENNHIDKVFLKNSSGKYVVPGSSLKGVLRHQAQYILEKLWKDNEDLVKKFLNNLMGYSVNIENRKKSRFYVYESVLNDTVQEKINTRNRIDRITGGVMAHALFTTVPVYQRETGKPAIKIKYYIKPESGRQETDCNNSYAEIGLALLLFRDLWQGRIAIGGETSVGRGTLKGISGKFTIEGCKYTMNAKGEISCENGNVNKLDEYVQILAQEVG